LSSKRSIKFLVVGLIIIISCSFYSQTSYGWYQNESYYPDHRRFTTHQWLAKEALDMFTPEKVQWITNDYLAFWFGVEAPEIVSSSYAYVGNGDLLYGDIYDYVLYFDGSGTTATNDSLASRAYTEYTTLYNELIKPTANFTKAAFYAGALTHYISQASSWGTLWDEAVWGSNYMSVSTFEYRVSSSNNRTYYPTPEIMYEYLDLTNYGNGYFSLTPNFVVKSDAYNATIALGQNAWQHAYYLGSNFDTGSTSVGDWSLEYIDKVQACLNYTVEAIYSVFEFLMDELGWNTIHLPTPTFVFNEANLHITIPEFEVTYSNKTGIYVLDDTKAEIAEVNIVQYQLGVVYTPIPPISISEIKLDLAYNSMSKKWFLPEIVCYGLSGQSNHTIMFGFKMDQSSYTYSNESLEFINTDYVSAEVSGVHTTYNSEDRTLSITDVSVNCPEIPEIGLVNVSEALSAEWILYITSYEYSQFAEPIGVIARDTEGNSFRGNLLFDESDNIWYSLNNDISLVYTYPNTFYYVKVRFTLVVPVGYETISPITGMKVFYPFTQGFSIDYFQTRDHEIFISAPTLTYNEQTDEITASGITATQDYNNIELDYYQMYEKYVWGDDIRKTYLYIYPTYYDDAWDPNDDPDEPKTLRVKDLSWNETSQSWYRVYPANLISGYCYVYAGFRTMNVNETITGLHSNIVEIHNTRTKILTNNGSLIFLPTIILTIIYIRKRIHKN